MENDVILDEFTIIEIKEKVGVCPKDKWLINSYYESTKKDKQYYKLQLANDPIIRPIAILDKKLLDDGISGGTIIVLGKHAVKKEKTKNRRKKK